VAVELRSGLGKDGNPNFWYVARYPTRYFWVERVKRNYHNYVNRDAWARTLWANTYERHPPAKPRPHLSGDLWSFGGRGDPLTGEKHQRAFNMMFLDPDPPDIWWIISNGEMWLRDPQTFGVRRVAMAQDDTDNAHRFHIHRTDLERAAQDRFRRQERIWVPKTVEEVPENVDLEYAIAPLTREDLAEFLAENAGGDDEDYEAEVREARLLDEDGE